MKGADIYEVYLQNYVDKDSAFDNDCYYFVQKEKWSGKVDNNNIYRTTKEPYIYIKGKKDYITATFNEWCHQPDIYEMVIQNNGVSENISLKNIEKFINKCN